MSTDLPINLENPFPNPNEVKPAEKISPTRNFPERILVKDKEAEEKEKEEKKERPLAPDSFGKKGRKIDIQA